MAENKNQVTVQSVSYPKIPSLTLADIGTEPVLTFDNNITIEKKDEKEKEVKESLPFEIVSWKPFGNIEVNHILNFCSLCNKKINEKCIECSKTVNSLCDLDMGKCGHSFHTHCIKKWLHGSDDCPEGSACKMKWVSIGIGQSSIEEFEKAEENKVKQEHRGRTFRTDFQNSIVVPQQIT